MADLKALIEKIESVSNIYAAKSGIVRDTDWFLFKLQEEIGELTRAHLAATNRRKPSGQDVRQNLSEEVADVFCHLLLYARNQNIDVTSAVETKWFSWLKADDNQNPHEITQ